VDKAKDAHFSNDMYLSKDKAREEKLSLRHKEEQELLTKLMQKKTLELKKLEDQSKKLNSIFMGNSELQKCINEINTLKDEIEIHKVQG
jgi:hypothetical protein